MTGMNRIKKFFCILLLTAVLVTGQSVPVMAASETPDVQATAAVLMDLKTGKILYEKNENKIMEPASITKVMTCMLVLRNLDLDKTVTIDRDMNVLGHTMDLKKGEKLTVRQLLYGMMVWSANDAAVVLAEQVSGSVDSFARLATKTAHGLGATSTVYKNPNGLNDVTGHVTTAKDLAVICREAMKYKMFRKLVSTVRYTIPATNKSAARKLKSTNRLLYDTKTTVTINGEERHLKYKGAFGIKTGETGTAGSCVAGGAKRGGTEFIAVVLDSPDNTSRFTDCITLLDYGFDNYHTYTAYKAGEAAGKVSIGHGSRLKVDAVAKKGIYATMSNEGSDSLVSKKVVMRDDLTAPVKKGTKAGVVDLYADGEKVGQGTLVVSESVSRGGPWTAIGISDMTALMIGIILAILLALLILILNLRRKNRRALESHRRKAAEARQRQEEEEARRIAAEKENKRRRDWPY